MNRLCLILIGLLGCISTMKGEDIPQCVIEESGDLVYINPKNYWQIIQSLGHGKKQGIAHWSIEIDSIFAYHRRISSIVMNIADTQQNEKLNEERFIGHIKFVLDHCGMIKNLNIMLKRKIFDMFSANQISAIYHAFWKIGVLPIQSIEKEPSQFWYMMQLPIRGGYGLRLIPES